MGFAATILSSVAAVAALSCSAAATPASSDSAVYPKRSQLTTDVVVLGGGSAGIYGAYALQQAGQSVIVVERAARLGGHFDTYTDPATKTPVDYGVQLLLNNNATQSIFAHYGIPLTDFEEPPVPFVIADFTTGKNVSAQAQSDYSGYFAQVSQYPYITQGDNFPNPPPADFSLPFGQFITKYSLQNEAYAIFSSPACSGLGNILNQPTIVVFRCLNGVTAQEGAPNGAVVTAAHNFSQLAAAAQAQLGSNALLSSWVIGASRPKAGTNGTSELLVQTPSGQVLINAKQVLVAYPQDIANMAPLGLDSREQSVFPRFQYTAWYTGLVQNTGLTEAFYQNAGATTQYNIPQLPGLYNFIPTAVPGLYNFWYGSDFPVQESTVLQAVNSALQELTGKPQNPQVVAYSNHTPYNLHLDPHDIQAGFYTQFANLQGYRDTYYTGAVLALPSGLIWQLTQEIVDSMVAALN